MQCLSKCMFPLPPSLPPPSILTTPLPHNHTHSPTGPESCNEDFVGGMPKYSGFELDVFKTLVQFFHSEREPLVTSALYDLYMAVLSEWIYEPVCNGHYSYKQVSHNSEHLFL